MKKINLIKSFFLSAPMIGGAILTTACGSTKFDSQNLSTWVIKKKEIINNTLVGILPNMNLSWGPDNGSQFFELSLIIALQKINKNIDQQTYDNVDIGYPDGEPPNGSTLRNIVNKGLSVKLIGKIVDPSLKSDPYNMFGSIIIFFRIN